MYTSTSMYDINHMVESLCRRPSFLMQYFHLRFILTIKFEKDPTLNRNDNGSLYREPFYFDIFDLRYMLNLISTLTLTFVTDKKKVLPKYQFEEDKVQFKKKGALLKEFLNQIFYLLLRLLPKLMPSEIFV